MHLCFVGCGFIAGQHARIIRILQKRRSVEPIRLSFASRQLEKAKSFKNSYDGAFAFGTYREGFANEEVDTVVVCTPNSDHHVSALEAIAHHKHVIVEKPFTTTVAAADEILANAAAAGVSVYVAENHRYLPHVRWLEGLIEGNALGTLKMVRINSMQSLGFHQGQWRASTATMGGGVLIDGGIHWVNNLLTLGGGEATSVTAVESVRSLAGCPGEDTVVVTCALKNGAAGVLTYSWNVVPSFLDGFMSVHGDKGSAYVTNNGRFGATMAGNRLRPRVFPRKDREGVFAMWKDFLGNRKGRNESETLASGQMGRRDLAFVEAAYRSLQG